VGTFLYPSRTLGLQALMHGRLVGQNHEGRFVLTDASLSLDNSERPTGEAMANTLTPGNIEAESTSAGDMFVRTKPW
jgi:hypothetical protein